MDGELLTLWTIRLSLVAYSAALVGFLAVDWRAHQVLLRWIWTAGVLLLAAHFVCAFHFYHQWSHAHAAEQTSAETWSLLGWSFGGEIYFNYLLLAVWSLDAAWWWTAAASYEQRRGLVTAAVHGYIFLIAFNGAVVFETGPTRWVGIAVTVILALLLLRRRMKGTSDGD